MRESAFTFRIANRQKAIRTGIAISDSPYGKATVLRDMEIVGCDKAIKLPISADQQLIGKLGSVCDHTFSDVPGKATMAEYQLMALP